MRSYFWVLGALPDLLFCGDLDQAGHVEVLAGSGRAAVDPKSKGRGPPLGGLMYTATASKMRAHYWIIGALEGHAADEKRKKGARDMPFGAWCSACAIGVYQLFCAALFI